MDINKHDLESDFKEFILERTMNIQNNQYWCSSSVSKDEERDSDMSKFELTVHINLTVAAYKRGFADAMLLFCK